MLSGSSLGPGNSSWCQASVLPCCPPGWLVGEEVPADLPRRSFHLWRKSAQRIQPGLQIPQNATTRPGSGPQGVGDLPPSAPGRIRCFSACWSLYSRCCWWFGCGCKHKELLKPSQVGKRWGKRPRNWGGNTVESDKPQGHGNSFLTTDRATRIIT